MLRRFSVTVGGMLALLVASGALLLSFVVPVLEPTQDEPATAPGRSGAPADQDERERDAPSATAPVPRPSPAPTATGPVRPAPTERATPAGTPARTPAESARSASSPPSVPTPPPPTVPAPPTPARQLQFLPSDDPLVCDASDRTAGTLRGADPGEAIVLTSPDLHRPIVLSADTEGSATVMWSCDPDAARTVELTAWGAEGRRDLTFPVMGVSEPGASSLAEIDAQARVDAAADLVLDAVESAPDTGAEQGFAGVVVAPDEGEIHLYWKGEPPQPVADAIERADIVTGLPVTVRPATFTRRHLLERADVLVADDRTPTSPLTTRLTDRIYRVAVLPEGTGLEVGIARPAGLGADGVARWSRRARGTLEAALGVPVHLVVDPAPMQFDRVADSPPWLGGARIVGDGRCSSGFGVRVEPRSSSPFGLLTAAHCRGDGQGRFRTGDGTRVVGPDVGSGDPGLDSRLVPVDEVGARIYSGGVGDDAEFTRPVRRSGRNITGDEACTSGAATGAHCDLVIVNVDSFYRPAGSTTYSSVVEAMSRHPGTHVAAGQGDSGGPVFTLTSDGGVEARGTIAGGSREIPCGRDHLGACTADVFFVDIEPALDHHEAELVTTNERA